MAKSDSTHAALLEDFDDAKARNKQFRRIEVDFRVDEYLEFEEEKLVQKPFQALSLRSKFDSDDEGEPQEEDEGEYIELSKRSSLKNWISLAVDEVSIPIACFARILTSPHLTHLFRLSLWESYMDDSIVDHIAQSRNMKSLRMLSLNSIGTNDEPLDASLIALAKSKHVCHLRSLLLQGHYGTGGVNSLASSPNLANLKSLQLHGRLTGESIKSLVASPHLQNLTELDLGWFNEAMDDLGVQSLLESQILKQLRSLGLGATGLSDDGLEALADSPKVASIRRLDLSHNRMASDLGIRALLASPHMSQLEKLNLWNVHPISPQLRRMLVEKFGERVELSRERG